MAICPKCQSEMVAHGAKMLCRCGYQYALPQKKPTYNELLLFIEDMEYEKQFDYWLEVKDGM